MKKSHRWAVRSSDSQTKQAAERLAPYKAFAVGEAFVYRTTKSLENGEHVIIKVTFSQRKALVAETTKKIREMIASPISPEQREKATHLAMKARAAQASPVTAKFRRAIHGAL